MANIKENTLSALLESISGSERVKNLIINNILDEKKGEIRLNLVYLTYNFSSKMVLIEYYAEDHEYPKVELSFDDLIALVNK